MQPRPRADTSSAQASGTVVRAKARLPFPSLRVCIVTILSPCDSGHAFRKFFNDRQRRQDRRPAGIERQVGQHLGRLLLRESVVHCSVQVICDLGNLARSDERTDRDQAAVAGARAGRSQRSRKSKSVVYCTTPGATVPKFCSTAAARCASAFSFNGSSRGETSGSWSMPIPRCAKISFKIGTADNAFDDPE